MFVAKVTGSLVATQKVDAMVGHKLLVVEPYRVDPADRNRLVTTGRTFVAVDTLGAGVGEYVLITQGSSARMTPETLANEQSFGQRAPGEALPSTLPDGARIVTLYYEVTDQEQARIDCRTLGGDWEPAR